MASAYSIIRDYGDYIQPYDFNLITKGLEYKQSKYDANAVKIQEEINKLTNLDLYRDVDKAYLHQKIKKVTELINATPHLDLSENGVVNSIHAQVSDVVDDKVMTAYMGTQAVRNYFKTVKNIKDKHPKQYSPVNDAYGRQPIMEWLSKNEVGTEFKGTEYIPFTDVSGKMVNTLKEFYKDSKSVIEVPEIVDGKPTGRMVKKTFKGLNPDEVATIFEMQLNPNDRKQLEINAWATFERNPEQTINTFKNYTEKRKEELHKELQKAKKAGEKDKITYYESALDNFQTTTQNMLDNNDIKGISNYMQKEVVLGDLKNAFRKRRVSLEYKEDAAYWKGLNYSLNKAKLQLAQKKYNDKKLQQQLTSGSLDGINNGISDTTVRDNIPETESKKETFYNALDKAKNTTIEYTNNVLNTVLSEQKDEIEQEAKDLTDSEKGITYEQALMTVVNRKLNDLPTDNDTVVNFKQKYKQYKSFVETADKIHKEVVADINKTADDRVKILFDKDNTEILKKYEKVLGKRLVGKDFDNLSYYDKKSVKQAMMLDLIIAKTNNNDLDGIDELTEAYNTEFGGDIRVDKIVIPATHQGFSSGKTGGVVGKLASNDKNTISLLSRAINNNFGKDYIFTDGSAYYDDDIKRNFNGKSIENRYESLIDNSIVANQGRKMVSFNPILNDNGQQKQTVYQRALRNAVGVGLNDADTQYLVKSTEGNILGYTNIDYYGGVDELNKKLSKDDKSTLSLIWDSGVDKGKAEVRIGGEKFLIRKDIIAKELGKVGLQFDDKGLTSTSLFVAETGKSVEPVKYLDKSKMLKNKEYYAKNLGGEEFVLDKTTSVLKLFEKYPQLKGEVKQLVADMYDKTDSFKTSVEIDKGNVSIDILDENDKVIYTKVYSKEQFSGIQTAQKFYNDAVRTQIIAPSYWVFRMFDDVIGSEVTKTYSDYRLIDLYNNIYGNQTNR